VWLEAQGGPVRQDLGAAAVQTGAQAALAQIALETAQVPEHEAVAQLQLVKQISERAGHIGNGPPGLKERIAVGVAQTLDKVRLGQGHLASDCR